MIRVAVTSAPIGALDVQNNAHGAIVTFEGVVRARNAGRDVVSVTYDAHAPLCEAVFSRIAEKAASAHGPLDVAIVHRVGKLAVGEASIVIAVSSEHRAEAFAACRDIIEAVKHEAPIWKLEHYVDGESGWVQGHSLCGR